VAASTDVAESLLKLAGGPSILGVGALLGYARGVLKSNERTPGKGWLTLGAGVLVCGWTIVFLALAGPTMLRSWKAPGDVQPVLVLLTATWFAAVGLLMAALTRAPAVARYLAESYHAGEGPWLVRMLRRLID
jgi:hypothetical protein